MSSVDFDKEARLLEQLTGIRESFLKRTRGELPLLRALLGRIQAGDSTALVQLQIFAHRIHGSGATFDFAAISESAGQVEKLLEIIGTSAVSVVEPTSSVTFTVVGESTRSCRFLCW